MLAVQTFLHWMGYGLCHQLPERSLFGGGVQVPVCARDTGIYFGVLISLGLVSLLHGKTRPRGLPTRAGWVAIVIMIGTMALDGGSEYAGLRGTTNELRLITGLLSGFAIGALLAPMINDELWRTGSPGRVLDTPWRLAVWLAAVPVAYVAVYWGLPLLGVGFPLLVAAAIVGTLVSVNLIMVCMLPPFERRAETLPGAWRPLLIALAVAVAEVWLSGLMRAGMVAFARTLGG